MSAGLRARILSHAKYKWFVLAVVAGGMMMSILNSSIVNMALPTIAEDFDAALSTVTWVIIVFTVTQATLMPVSGRAGDIYGRKRIFIAGVIIFAVNSLFCALSWNPGSLIVGRGLQAIGTSAISPMSLAFVFSVFPARDRARGIGTLGGINGIAPALGLLLGGFLVAGLGWRSVFLVSLPLAALIVPAAALVLKETPPAPEGKGFDVLGALLLSSGLYCGLLALNQGDIWGWQSPLTLLCFAAFAALLTSFVFWESHTSRPLLDPALFRYRSLVVANITGFFSSGAMFGALFMLPFYFQWVRGMSPWEFGWAIAPLALMFFIFAPLGGRLTTRLGARTTVMTGLLIAGAGYLSMSRVFDVDTGLPLLMGTMVLLGIGLALTMAPVTMSAIHEAPEDKRGVAASLPQMMRFIGASFVIALMGTFFTWRLGEYLLGLGVEAGGLPAGEMAAAARDGAMSEELLKQAMASTFQDVFLFALVFLGLALAAASFLPQLKGGGEEPAGIGGAASGGGT